MPVPGVHVPLVLSGDGVLTTRILAVPAYTVSGVVVSALWVLQEILRNLWVDLREFCSRVTFGWMAKTRNAFHRPVIIIKYTYMYPLMKEMNTKPCYLQVRAHSAE